ncbi:MAG: DUF4260 domain-containing protein [Acidimicrobiia bacterium]|jgi:hypothetical protein
MIGATWARPTTLLRLEGLALLVTSIWVFVGSGESWWVFGILMLVPDVTMVGYLHSAELGAATYNLGHTSVGPALLVAWAVISGSSFLVGLGAIWLAHIGFDRLAGYGLKYRDGFGHTHLGRIRSPASGRVSRPPMVGHGLRQSGFRSDRSTTDMEET